VNSYYTYIIYIYTYIFTYKYISYTIEVLIAIHTDQVYGPGVWVLVVSGSVEAYHLNIAGYWISYKEDYG
jgi:hypothetical protein